MDIGVQDRGAPDTAPAKVSRPVIMADGPPYRVVSMRRAHPQLRARAGGCQHLADHRRLPESVIAEDGENGADTGRIA